MFLNERKLSILVIFRLDVIQKTGKLLYILSACYICITIETQSEIYWQERIIFYFNIYLYHSLVRLPYFYMYYMLSPVYTAQLYIKKISYNFFHIWQPSAHAPYWFGDPKGYQWHVIGNGENHATNHDNKKIL